MQLYFGYGYESIPLSDFFPFNQRRLFFVINRRAWILISRTVLNIISHSISADCVCGSPADGVWLCVCISNEPISHARVKGGRRDGEDLNCKIRPRLGGRWC